MKRCAKAISDRHLRVIDCKSLRRGIVGGWQNENSKSSKKVGEMILFGIRKLYKYFVKGFEKSSARQKRVHAL